MELNHGPASNWTCSWGHFRGMAIQFYPIVRESRC